MDVTWLIPLILLVICLGLGMDYDILLTTRIRENVLKGMSNDEAIHHAVTHTGSVITICGLIMGGAFGTLMLSSMVMLQQFGFALCFAILCDALIVRTYIVPAIMHLLGDLNWKGPRFMQKHNV
ncbi:MAG: MMPL family transporter [Candidatus Methanomethylophilaceae archaeon]|nr:MMPL family transporter [Candidatus Methanomethylophilaceae archaeon]